MSQLTVWNVPAHSVKCLSYTVCNFSLSSDPLFTVIAAFVPALACSFKFSRILLFFPTWTFSMHVCCLSLPLYCSKQYQCHSVDVMTTWNIIHSVTTFEFSFTRAFGTEAEGSQILIYLFIYLFIQNTIQVVSSPAPSTALALLPLNSSVTSVLYQLFTWETHFSFPPHTASKRCIWEVIPGLGRQLSG